MVLSLIWPQTAIRTTPASLTVNNGTTFIADGFYVDWSLFKGKAYFAIEWGHAVLSTSGASTMQITLRDFTNGTDLANVGNTSSTATNTDASTALGNFVSFTKPSAGAKVDLQTKNTDATARDISMWRADIWVF